MICSIEESSYIIELLMLDIVVVSYKNNLVTSTMLDYFVQVVIHNYDVIEINSREYLLLQSIQFSILKSGIRSKCLTLPVTSVRLLCMAVAPMSKSMSHVFKPTRSSL